MAFCMTVCGGSGPVGQHSSPPSCCPPIFLLSLSTAHLACGEGPLLPQPGRQQLKALWVVKIK